MNTEIIKNPYYCANSNELIDLIKYEISLYISNEELYYEQIVSQGNKSGTYGAGGAVAGAVVGSMILPGIGTIIGGILGSIFGASAGDEVADTTVVTKETKLNEYLRILCNDPQSSFMINIEEQLVNEKKFFDSLLKLHIANNVNSEIDISAINDYIKVFNLAYEIFPTETKERLAEMYYAKVLYLYNQKTPSSIKELIVCLDKYTQLMPSEIHNIHQMKIDILSNVICDCVNNKKYSDAEIFLINLLNIDNKLANLNWKDNELIEIDEELYMAIAILYNYIGKNDQALNYIYVVCLNTEDVVRARDVLYQCYEKIYIDNHEKIYIDVQIMLSKIKSNKELKDVILHIFNGILVLLAKKQQYLVVLKYLNAFKYKLSNEMKDLKIKVSEHLLIDAYNENNIDYSITLCDIICEEMSLSNNDVLIIALYCYLDKELYEKANLIFDYLSKMLDNDIRLDVAKTRIMLLLGETSNDCFMLCKKTYMSLDEKSIRYIKIMFDLFNQRMTKDEIGHNMLLHCFKYLNTVDIARAVAKVAIASETGLKPDMLAGLEHSYELIKSKLLLERLADEYVLFDKINTKQLSLLTTCSDVNPEKYSVLFKICDILFGNQLFKISEIQYFIPAIKFYDDFNQNTKRAFYEYSTYLGLIYKKYCYFEKAEFYLGRALIDNKDYKLAGYELIDVYLANGRYNKAIELLDFFMNDHNCDEIDDEILYLYKGKYYYYIGDILNAEQCFEKALQLNPYKMEAREGLAQLGSITSERQKAIAQYINIIQINQDDTNAQLNIGVLYLQSGNDKDAEVHFKNAVHIDPNLIEAYMYLIQIYIKQEEIEKAEECLSKILYISSNNENIERRIRFISAIVQQHSKKYNLARDTYTYLLSEFGDDYRVFNNVACIYFEENKIDDYYTLLDKAIMLDKGNKIIEGNQKLALLKRKEYSDYIKWFEISDTAIDRFKLFAVAAYMECGFIEKASFVMNDINDLLLTKSDLKIYTLLKTIVMVKTRQISKEDIYKVEEYTAEGFNNNTKTYFDMLVKETVYDIDKSAENAYADYQSIYNNTNYVNDIYNRLAKRLSLISLHKFEELPCNTKIDNYVKSIENTQTIAVFDILNIVIKPILEESITSYGDWEISGTRMEGGMAYVTRVYNRKRNIYGALKELKPKLINNKTTRDNFSNEAYFLADSLNHKNIVKVLADTIDPYRCSYVMEYLTGGSLRNLLNTRKLTLSESATVIISILEALRFFHGLGDKYIHLDVTPENVMFNTNGEVKLTDFGISYFNTSKDIDYTDVEEDTSIAGKLPYMAPEIMCAGIKTQKADQYSVGVISYELLSGVLPYSPEDYEEAAEQAWIFCAMLGADKKIHELNPEVSIEISDSIHKMMAFNVEDRYDSISQVINKLKKCFVEVSSHISNVGISDTNSINIYSENINENKKDYKGDENTYSFEFWKPIGYRKTGATCHVSKVFNEKNGVFGALKILKPEYITNANLCKSFMLEAEFLANLNISGLTSVYKYSIDYDRYCYVMEWLDGKTLNEFSININEMLRLFKNIAEVIFCFHSLGANYVHLDISPQNIMIANDGQAYLLDFGSGYFGQDNANLNGRRGKYPYIAPEIYQFNKITQKADVYSLGVVFYKIITGYYPITPDSEYAPEHIWANEVIRKTTTDIRELINDINDDLADIIMKMINKDLNERPSMKDVIFDLKNI